jgi:hypothetical protein
MDFFEQVGTRGFYRPVARVTLEKGLEMMAVATRAARERALKDLLINTTGFTGYEIPSVFDRYDWATKLAASAGSALRVATVVRSDVFDPQKIGAVMAQNRGVFTDIFTSEAAALTWLDAGAATCGHTTAQSS